MLSRSFKSHDELQLTEPQHSALIKVLGMLERGELVRDDNRDHPNSFTMKGFWVDFNSMGINKRGGCLCGWACHILRENNDDLVTNKFHNGSAAELFCGGVNATCDQAARALNNYLVTGAPRWAEVLA